MNARFIVTHQELVRGGGDYLPPVLDAQRSRGRPPAKAFHAAFKGLRRPRPRLVRKVQGLVRGVLLPAPPQRARASAASSMTTTTPATSNATSPSPASRGASLEVHPRICAGRAGRSRGPRRSAPSNWSAEAATSSSTLLYDRGTCST